MKTAKAKREKRKPMYTVIIRVEGSRLATVEAQAQQAFGADAVRSVRKADLALSRNDRLHAIAESVETAATDVEELRDELQEWYDNLPEAFQSGDKGNDLEEAIGSLDSVKEELEAVDFDNVSFPAMF